MIDVSAAARYPRLRGDVPDWWDWRRAAGIAWNAAAYEASRWHRQDLTEDLAAAVLLYCWRTARRGAKCSARSARWHARDIRRKWTGDDSTATGQRRMTRHVRGDDATYVLDRQRPVVPSELGALAVWRLERAWPAMTTAERVAINAALIDEGYGSATRAAREAGCAPGYIAEARRRGLRRINR